MKWFSTVSLIMATVMFLFVGVAYSGGVDLADNVVTGMDYEQVDDHLDLDYHMSDRGTKGIPKRR